MARSIQQSLGLRVFSFMRYVDLSEQEALIRKYSYHWWEIRQKYGMPGTAEEDWDKAVAMVEAEYRMEHGRS